MESNKFSLSHDKHYFGVYLNLAQHNAFLILNEINEKLGGENVEEGALHGKQKNGKYCKTLDVLLNGKLEEQALALKILLKYLPFLRVFIGQDSENDSDQALTAFYLLQSSLERLNEERNFCSHFFPQKRQYSPFYWHKTEVADQQETLNQIQENFINFLGEDQSDQRKIAIRLYYDLIDQSPKQAEKPKESQKTKSQTFKGLDALRILQPEADSTAKSNVLISKTYADFCKYLKTAPQHLWQIENPKAFSEKGLVFFTSLFLDKKQANLFISNIYGLTDTRSPKDRLLRAMFLHHTCHLPQPRLESADILLDMLGELSKAPKELKNLLSEQDKESLELLKTIENPYLIQENEDGNIKSIEEFFRNSKDQRFPYLALRYFDETKAFKKMRFQLYLGKLVQNYYQKKMQGELEDRFILKELHTFGRLSDFDQKIFEKIASEKNWKFRKSHDENGDLIIDEKGDQLKAEIGEIVQFSPHYHFAGAKKGRIAFKFICPEIANISQKQNPKGELAFNKDQKAIFTAENTTPDAFISVHELPNLYLHHFLFPEFEFTSINLDTPEGKKTINEGLHRTKTHLADKSLMGKLNELFHVKNKNVNFHETIDLIVNLLQKGKSVEQIKEEVLIFESCSPSEYFIYQYILVFRQFFKDLKAGMLKPVSNEKLAKRKLSKKDLKGFLKSEYLPYDQAHFEKLVLRKALLQSELDQKYEGFIQISHLPDEVLRYLLGFYPLDYKKEVLGKIKAICLENSEKIKELEKIRNQKDQQNRLKAGNIADWLAADIIYLKPLLYPNDRKNSKQGKPNNDQYRHLQKMLALYGGNKDQLEQYFYELGLTHGKAAHPFLQKIGIANNLFGFYENYLKARSNYFGYHVDKEKIGHFYEKSKVEGIYAEIEGKYSKTEKKFKGGLENAEINLRFGHLFAFSLPPKNALSKNYADLPIMLPVGLFNKAILEGFSNKKGLKIKEKDNTVFALATYTPDLQVFYTKDRQYKFSEKTDFSDKENYEKQASDKNLREKMCKNLKTETQELAIALEKTKARIGSPDRLKTDKNYLAQKERFSALQNFRTFILETEKTIRYAEHTDRILWLMAKNLAKKRTSEGVQLDFKDAKLSQIHAFLNTFAEMQVEIKEGIVAQVFEREENGEIVMVEREIVDEKTAKKTLQKVPKVKGEDEYVALNLKQYGNLRKFAKDRRLPNFFAYFKETDEKPVFSKTQLERALDFLELHRHEILEKAFALEKTVHEKFETEFAEYRPKDEWIEHNAYITFLQNQKGMDLKGILGINNELLENDSELTKETERKNKSLEVADFRQTLEATLLIMLRNKIVHNQIPCYEYLKKHINPTKYAQKTDIGKNLMQALFALIVEIYDQMLWELKKM